MATLDDKLLGEKLHYYCSSSEDEGGSDDEGQGPRSQAAPAPAPCSGSRVLGGEQRQHGAQGGAQGLAEIQAAGD